MNWSEMTPRERDALVAETFEPKPSVPDDIWDSSNDPLFVQLAGNPAQSPLGFWRLLCLWDDGDTPQWYPLSLTTEIAAAWLVVEAMTDGGKGWMVERWTDNWWSGNQNNEGLPLDGWTWDDILVNEHAPTAPEAICLAALRAKGVDV